MEEMGDLVVGAEPRKDGLYHRRGGPGLVVTEVLEDLKAAKFACDHGLHHGLDPLGIADEMSDDTQTHERPAGVLRGALEGGRDAAEVPRVGEHLHLGHVGLKAT